VPDTGHRRKEIDMRATYIVALFLFIVVLAACASAASQTTETNPPFAPTTTPDTTEPSTTVPTAPVDPTSTTIVSGEISVEWTEVTGGNPPYAGPMDRTLGTPFVIDDGTTQRVAIVSGTDDTPYSLWTSENGIAWVETELSLPMTWARRGFESTPTGHWIFGRDPGPQLWYSSDLASGWQEINLDGLTNQTMYPLTGEPKIRSVATVGDTTLIAVQYTLVFDWDELLDELFGIEPGTYDYYDYDYDGDAASTENRQAEQLDPIVTLSGRAILEDEDTSETLLRFIPSTTADGVILTNADSGETLLEFPNYDAFDWEDIVGQEAYPRFETELSMLMAVTPDGVEAVGPWSSGTGTSPSIGSIRLIEMHDGIFVYGRDADGFSAASYVTRDGATFEAVESPPFAGVRYDEASGHLYTSIADPLFGVERHWISPDGVTWTPIDTLPELQAGSDVSTLSPVAGGWLYQKNGTATSSFSLDGQDWYPVEITPALGRDLGPPVAWGNRLLIFGQDSNWVGTVDTGDR
jgi:hypothetical protein